jgi:hypothetical protein
MSWSSCVSVVAGLVLAVAPLPRVAIETAMAAGVESSACVNTPQAGKVSGVVTDKTSGSAVPYSSGARVRLVDLDEEVVIACVIADSLGRYAIDTSRTGSGYLISVDPAPGSLSSLGSTGGQVRLTSTSITRNYSLGTASYQGVATFNGAFPTDTYVCLLGDLVHRCGFVVARSDSESPRFSIYEGGEVAESYSLIARKKAADTNLSGYLELSSVTNTTNLNIQMQQNFGDVSKTNGCNAGQTPNVFGRVTLGGSAYVTTVKLGQGWAAYSSTTAPDNLYLALTATTAIDGSYQFCVDTSSADGVPKVLRAAALVSNIGTSPGLGETYSTWADATCLLSALGCDIPSFEMQPKSLWGTVVFDGDGDSSTPPIPLSNASIDINKRDDDDWYRNVRTDSSGRYALAGVPLTGDYNVYIYPSPSCDVSNASCSADTDVNSGALSKSETLNFAGSPKEMNIEVDRGNVVISALDPDGLDLSTLYSSPNARIIPSTDSCRADAGTNTYTTECRTEVSSTYYEKSPMAFNAKLTAGTYDVLTSASGFATSMSTISVSSTGSVTVVSGPLVSSGSNRFIQRLSSGNMKFQINKGSAQSQVRPDSIEISYLGSDSSVPSFSTSEFQGYIDYEGFARWNAQRSGIYRFNFGATSGRSELAGYVSTAVTYKISFVNGIATVTHSCTGVSASEISCTGVSPTILDGAIQVSLKNANFEGELCSALPSDSCAVPSAFYPMVRLNRVFPTSTKPQPMTYRLRSTKFYFDIPYVSSAQNFNIYTMSIQLSDRGLYTNQVRILKVTSAGVISLCGTSAIVLLTSPCSTTTALDVDSSTGRTVLPRMRLKIGNVRGQVLEPGNSSTPVRDSRICFIEASKIGDFCTSQNSYLLDPFYTNTSQDGEFAVDLPPGTYRVQATPSSSESETGSEYSAGVSTFTIGSDGVLQGTLIVRLTQPNIVGEVLAGTSPAPFSSIQTFRPSQNSNTGWEQAGFGSSSKSNGRYYLNLTQGTWKLSATPNGAQASSFTVGSVVIVVDANGAVQTVNGVAYNGGAININFGTPNLKLSLGTTGISDLSVNLQKRNSSTGLYEYMNENGYYYMSSSRGAAIQLAEGRYMLNLYPYSSPNYVTTSYFFKVDSSGVICTVANKDSTTCVRTLTSGEVLSLTLNGPNIKGVVRNGAGGTGARSYLQVERFNTVSQNFEWSSDLQGVSTNESGVFSMRLPVGFYRITANPSMANSGFTKGIEYVVVYEESSSGKTWCRPGGINPAPCTEALKGLTDSFDVNLRSANVKGLVKFGSDVVQSTYINVEKWANQRFEWINESSSVIQGAFAVKLDGGSDPVKYRITVNQPNPNNLNLGKRKLTLWVGDFVNGGTNDDVCIQDILLSGSTIPQKCSAPIQAGTQFDVQMSLGNVVGQVSDPNGNAIANSSIEVRVWTNSYWNWTDNYSQSSATGSYALNLESGVYQVTARVPYGSSTFTNSAAHLISVNSNGTWCKIASTDNTTCTESPTQLALSLRNPNLSGTLKDGSTTISGVWMYLQKLQTSGSYSWWNWLDVSAMTGSTGQFALNLSDDGKYRLEVSAPYGNSQLPRFYKYYTVASGKICEGESCTPSLTTLSSQELLFPTPNFVGTVYSPTNQRVSNLGVDVEVWDAGGNYWRWANLYANVGSNGSFAMLLPNDGRYRLRVNPPWNGAGYPRFTQVVEVDSIGKVCAGQGCSNHVSSLALDLRFPTANVRGTVVLKSDGLASSISRWSWLYAYNGSSYEWANASSAGEFSMFLADGDWTMWFYPDYSRSSAQPIRVLAKIEGGALTSWRYAVDISTMNKCSGTGQCSMDVSFSYIPPNVRVKVLSGGAPLAGAFVQLTNQTTQENFDFTTDSNGLIEGLVPAASYSVTAVKVVGSSVSTTAGTVAVDQAIQSGTISIVLEF